MKTLITNIETFLKSGVTAGTINIGGIKITNIDRGISNDPTQIQATKFPYIEIDDGGERTEEASSEDTLWRIYSVVLEFAVFHTNIQTALDNLLDLSTQIETVLKAAANRQEDDMIWGINITPYAWDEDRFFYRGRHVTVEYRKLEFTSYDRY